MTPDDATIPAITAVRLSGAATREELPLLVLGPAVGESALDLWVEVAADLDDAFDVLAWDLPGQGYNAPLPPGAPDYTVASLSAGVVRVVDDVLAQRGELGRACAFAGVGIGGEVARHLLAETPERVTAALSLDDVPIAERASAVRTHLLGEEADDRPAAHLDERQRALVALVAAAATGRDTGELARAARAAGLSREQVDEASALAAPTPDPGSD